MGTQVLHKIQAYRQYYCYGHKYVVKRPPYIFGIAKFRFPTQLIGATG
jgi:hypothetical protein